MYVIYLWGGNMGPIAWSHCGASPSYDSGWGNKFSVSVSVAEIFEPPTGLFAQFQFDDGDVPQCIYYTTGSLTNYSMHICTRHIAHIHYYALHIYLHIIYTIYIYTPYVYSPLHQKCHLKIPTAAAEASYA